MQDLVQKIGDAVTAFRQRLQAIDANLGQGQLSFADRLRNSESEALASTIRRILQPEYEQRLAQKSTIEEKITALQLARADLDRQVAGNLADPKETDAFETGSSDAACRAYRLSVDPSERTSLDARRPVNFSHFLSGEWLGTLIDFLLIAAGGLLGGWLNASQFQPPEAFEHDGHLNTILFGIAAAWVRRPRSTGN
jgi:hypothetical protein